MKIVKKHLLLLLIPVAVMLISCGENDLPQIDTVEALNQSWTHAREEQGNANSPVQIYRLTSSREFAPSRFRDAYEFRADGSCRYMVLHPADAHYMAEGKYTYDQSDSVLSIYGLVDELVKQFAVVRLETDLLVMELKQ